MRDGQRRWATIAVAAAAGWWAARQARRQARRLEFDGAVALVTGGSRGLGLALARQLLDAGARVAICARDGAALDRARAELEARAGDPARVYAAVCDVTDPAAVCQLVTDVGARLGPVDVLVNNAGIIQVGPTEQMRLADYDEAMRINYYGPLHAALAVIPGMRERRRGRIVNVASIAGKTPVPHLVPYGASKYALVGLSENLRAVLARDDVWVTTVCPGEMRTGSPRHATFKGDHEAEYAWFTATDHAPVASMDADRAAALILDACRHGDAELVMPGWAWLQARLHGLAPALSTALTALADRALPAPAPGGEAPRRGAQADSARTPEWARAAELRMAGRYNQLPG
ncbi:SDR family oxidoreductase [Roseisolibacter sp. H3M3-2]|uniref:SDR family NAD(P)-dependent oxidoreductase n=1 Tax=Roseisolibacter sp. H3M3-2 TaxID=3031323 RepID=UPI0023DA90E0|nr:SDR family oxidoreductase [Roseisolibacter sp. H3M3-2]MDF1505343.1 SDR family oxidoreductase [Roseisolibacter sp. H3M3-2]